MNCGLCEREIPEGVGESLCAKHAAEVDFIQQYLLRRRVLIELLWAVFALLALCTIEVCSVMQIAELYWYDVVIWTWVVGWNCLRVLFAVRYVFGDVRLSYKFGYAEDRIVEWRPMLWATLFPWLFVKKVKHGRA